MLQSQRSTNHKLLLLTWNLALSFNAVRTFSRLLRAVVEDFTGGHRCLHGRSSSNRGVDRRSEQRPHLEFRGAASECDRDKQDTGPLQSWSYHGLREEALRTKADHLCACEKTAVHAGSVGTRLGHSMRLRSQVPCVRCCRGTRATRSAWDADGSFRNQIYGFAMPSERGQPGRACRETKPSARGQPERACRTMPLEKGLLRGSSTQAMSCRVLDNEGGGRRRYGMPLGDFLERRRWVRQSWRCRLGSREGRGARRCRLRGLGCQATMSCRGRDSGGGGRRRHGMPTGDFSMPSETPRGAC